MINLQRFAANTNVMGTDGTVNAAAGSTVAYTVGMGLSEEMKTYYSDYLIDNAEPALVHDMFAQKHQIPQGGGKTVQFRRYNPLPKLTEPIREGVTPAGQSINMEVLEATVAQYGGYVELTDLLILTAIDNNLCMATKLLGSQAGRTLDTITREVLCGGTNVQYGEDAVSARYLLVGGEPEGNHYLTVDCIKRAVRSLKR
jgi:N4-gp56 family major capsid protein